MLYSFKFWDLHDAPVANRLTKETEVIKRRMFYYSSKLIADQAPKGRLLITLDTDVPERIYISKKKAAAFKEWIVNG